MTKIFTLVIFTTYLILSSNFLFAKTKINIAAASDMNFALLDLKKEFESKNPNSELGITMGSSGKLYEQILNGAPFDLFFSADEQYPNKLKAAHIGNEIYLYAKGKIVLWSLQKKSFRLDDLKDPQFKKIAIANPAHAPYGNRAVEALKKILIYDSIKDRLVYGENISQAAQFVETGAADIGIVALSTVLATNLKELGSYSLIPENDYSPLNQAVILLKQNDKIALDFFQFIKSDQAKAILQKYGFALTGK